MARISPEELIAKLPKDSFLCDWLQAWPTTEFPWSYFLFGGLSVLGAAIGRRCWYVDDYRKLYPMLNLLLIGPSGIGKSSAIELNQTLMSQLEPNLKPQFVLGSATPEKLHTDLALTPHAIVYASELSNFFGRQKYMEGMVPYVTELLDCRPVQRRTQGGNIQHIEEPEVTIIGGSTVEWLQEQLPDNAIGGGFLPRFLIVKEDEKRQRVPNASMAISKKRWSEMMRQRENAYDAFSTIVSTVSGGICFAGFDVADVYSRWYMGTDSPHGHLAAFAARAPEFVKRLAMLVAISASRDVINEEDLLAAIAMYDYVLAKLAEVVVPKSPQGKLQLLILANVPPYGATAETIFKSMRNLLPATEVEKYLYSLIKGGDLRRVEDKFYPTESL